MNYSKLIYRVVYWDDDKNIKVTALTTYEDAYNTAESCDGVIYRLDKTQPTKGKK